MEEIYKEFLNYDWDSFQEFQDGLKEILDSYLENMKEQDASVTAVPALDRQQLVDQAKSYFYSTKTGNILNLDDYRQWKYKNGDRYVTSNQIEAVEANEESTIPQASNKPQRIEEVTDLLESEPKPAASETDDPPYSSNYQDLVELIVSGKPVPGIKEIPNTVLPEQSSISAAKQRVKPWELNK